MTFIADELLEMSPDDLYDIAIPFDADGFGRLRPILYMARWHLNDHSHTNIEQACEDIIMLYDWFFNRQKKQMNAELDQELNSASNTLIRHVDRSHYLTDRIEAMKIVYQGHVDILQAILTECEDIQTISDIECVKSDFTNAEFFCVLALYKGTLILTELRRYLKARENQQHVDDIPFVLPGALGNAINNLLEAQVAIDYAERRDLLESTANSYSAEEWNRLARQGLTRRAMAAKFGEKYQLRRKKAIELYQKGQFKSRRQAALALIDTINAFSEEHKIKALKQGSEFETIYSWLSDYDTKKTP